MELVFGLLCIVFGIVGVVLDVIGGYKIAIHGLQFSTIGWIVGGILCVIVAVVLGALAFAEFLDDMQNQPRYEFQV